MADPKLGREDFRRRYLLQFVDPAFDRVRAQLDAVEGVAWESYDASHKAPITRKAGPEFADPDYDMSVDWLDARAAIAAAQKRHDDPAAVSRILIVNGSPRNDHTCPGEMSKSWRFVEIARQAIESSQRCETEVLDLSRLLAEYGRNIHPCKACFSTSAALCHWPCSCYPNHGLGQTQDWMNEIYPMWVAAHGVMIITPVHWYQASSPLKLLIDRMVCADGGNPDPTSTQGKDAKLAKQIEMRGWDYPRHLQGRPFSVVVHGDTEGVENVRRAISDWLTSMDMVSAGAKAELDRYIGYWKPYATSHAELDRDEAVQQEVANAARTLIAAVTAARSGRLVQAGEDLSDPRQK
jgi:multimeric flavodoxin WrbA